VKDIVHIKDYCTSWKGLIHKKGIIHGLYFEKLNFESLDFSTVHKIEDTAFKKCRSDKRAEFVLSGTHLSNVHFDNFDVPKMFFYWKDSHFSNVKISGRKINYIRVFRSHDEKSRNEVVKHEGVMFDLSECQTSDVGIYGLAPENIIINPEKHYALDIQKLVDDSWNYTGKPLNSFILSANLKGLTSRKQRYGVFGKYKDDDNDELEYLQSLMG